MSSLFKDEQAHPLVLLRKYLSMFGLEALEWEPEVIRRSIQDETGTTVAKINLMKLMAAISVANHDSFWRDWQSFHFLSQALNNNVPSAGELQNQSVGQLMVAVDIANAIRADLGAVSTTPEFSESVARYIAAQAQEAGVWYLPSPLDFANQYSAGFMQKCLRCENEEEEQADGLCSYCTERYNTDSLQKMEPDPSLAKKWDASKVVKFVKYPYAEVSNRLTEILTKKAGPLKETQNDICVGKLVVALEYMSYRRAQLRTQSEVR